MPAEIYLLLSIISSASISLILKRFNEQKGNRYGLFFGNYLTCVCIALAGLYRRQTVTAPGRELLILGLISGALFVAGLIGTQNGIRQSGAALTAAFAKLGLIVPLAVSILVFGERPRSFQLAGLLLVFLAIFIIQPPHRRDEPKNGQEIRLLPLIAVLFICGTGDAMIKIFENTGQADNGSMFFLILFGSAAVFTLIFFYFEYRRTGLGFDLTELLAGVIVGVPNYFASALLLKALTKFPAFIVYPCYSTGTILLVLIVSSILFGEKIDRRTGAGLAVILAALVILNV